MVLYCLFLLKFINFFFQTQHAPLCNSPGLAIGVLNLAIVIPQVTLFNSLYSLLLNWNSGHYIFSPSIDTS